MNLNDILASRVSSAPRVESLTGVFLGIVDGLARVNLQGSTVDLRCDGWYPPTPGMPVRVNSTNGILRVTGPASPQGGRAEVLESLDGGQRARISVGGREYELPVMEPYIPLPGDVAVVNWTTMHVLGAEATAPASSSPAPNPGGGGGAFGGLLVQSVDSGRYSTSYSNWFGNSDVWTGVTTQGAWFYGGGFGVLAGAEITGVEIYLPLIREQNNLDFGLHPHPSKPSGSPGIGFFSAAPGRSGWVPLPSSWGNTFRDNPGWGVGVVSPGGGQNQWVGRASDPMSGALRFSGTR